MTLWQENTTAARRWKKKRLSSGEEMVRAINPEATGEWYRGGYIGTFKEKLPGAIAKSGFIARIHRIQMYSPYVKPPAGHGCGLTSKRTPG